MSNVKRSFNGRTVLMFLGCLALSIVITQPILARADGNDVVINTSFTNSHSLSTDFINIGDTQIMDGQICNSNGNCIDIDGDSISVNKIQIGLGQFGSTTGVLILSGNILYLYNAHSEYSSRTAFPLNEIFELVNRNSFPSGVGGFLKDHGFGWTNTGDANNVRPIWEKTGWINKELSFKAEDANVLCSADNAGTFHYLENERGSKLIMCMKIDDNEYTGATLKEYSRGSSIDVDSVP